LRHPSSTTAQSSEALLNESRTRPILISAIVLIVVGAVAVGTWWTTGVIVDGDRLTEPPSSFFDDNHDDLERVLVLVESGDLTANGYYGPTLPANLQHLSATGKVSIYEDGSFFIPRWTGIPDDAGGIWWSRSSPESRDMYGMTCVDPADLVGNWWLCG
jgi:hypothetical protein